MNAGTRTATCKQSLTDKSKLSRNDTWKPKNKNKILIRPYSKIKICSSRGSNVKMNWLKSENGTCKIFLR